MTNDPLSQVVKEVLNAPDLKKIRTEDIPFWFQHLKAAVNTIPFVGGAIAEEMQVCYDYKQSEFFRKFASFIVGLEETTVEERQKFAEDITEASHDFSGNVIVGMVDRLDNINKQKAFSKIAIARIRGEISIEDFFRLHILLERIPYVDFKELPKYKEPFYDTNGDTDFLFATGALEMSSVGQENKFILSRLGEMLLKWGFDIDLSMEHGKGTTLDANFMTSEEVHEMVNEIGGHSEPIVEGETLKFEQPRYGKRKDDN